MKNILALILLFPATISYTQSYKKLHEKAILADTHNDLLSSQTLEGRDISQRLSEGHSDLYRMSAGGLDIQFFSVWTGERARNKEGFYKDANQEIDSLKSLVFRNYDRMVLARNYREVKKGLRQKKLVSLIGVEGGHMIEDDLSKLDALYQRGMRYLTLTWNNSTSWATSAKDETEKKDLTSKGLNEFGKQVVRRMNELGVIVDLSHVGEKTFYDALAITTKPVMLSHSSVHAIAPVFRNVKDEQIRAVAENGGVICINFFSAFIDSIFAKRFEDLVQKHQQRIKDSLKQYYDAAKMNEVWSEFLAKELEACRPGLKEVVDHIDYIVKLVGDDYVGIGSDYDGISFPPKGLEDVTTYPLITEELLKRGYSRKSIKKILGGNVLRVMKANF